MEQSSFQALTIAVPTVAVEMRDLWRVELSRVAEEVIGARLKPGGPLKPHTGAQRQREDAENLCLHVVIHGPATAAQTRIGADGLRNEALRLLNRAQERSPLSQRRRDRGGIGAACAMCVASLHACRGKFVPCGVGVENVDGNSGKMAAFHENGARA